MIGEKMNRAPAKIAARAVSASRTDPAPTSAEDPSSWLARAMASNAPGVVMVISQAFTPPAERARQTLTNSSPESARITAMTPVSMSCPNVLRRSVTDISMRR
jgi:hypothetical protein